MYVELIDKMGDEKKIVNAARVSFNKSTDMMSNDDIKLLKYLYDNKHTTPFEHVVFTFEVKCPLFIRAQWFNK